jgi:hypothetical protein
VQDIHNPSAWQKLYLCAQKTENDWLILQAGAGLVAMDLAPPELHDIFSKRDLSHRQQPASLPNPETVKKLITHPLTRNHAQPFITALSSQVPKMFGKPLSHLGLLQQHRMNENDLSESWQSSLETVYQILRFQNKLVIFENHQHMPLDAILAPTSPMSLVLQPKARTGQVTLQSVFFLARAVYWAQPNTQLLTLLRLDELRGVTTALRAFLLKEAPPSSANAAIRMGQKIVNAYLKNLSDEQKPASKESLTQNLKHLLESDDRKEAQKHFQGTSLSSNRLGLLITGDLLAASRSLVLLHQRPLHQGNSLVIRDLLGFGISEGLQQIRAQMGMISDPILISRLYKLSRLN